MKLSTKLILATATVLALSTSIQAGGDILTDKAGMTLYTFDNDSNNVSACYGPCAEKWPPFVASSTAEAPAGWGMTERKDGSMQWTYNNQPLYTWIGDSKAGDTTGDGVGGVWHTATKVTSGSDKKPAKKGYDY